jgi:AcrR family transcriptional regulator
MRAIAAREDVRDLILDAADRLLARYGYRKMTMDDLALEVGIGKGTLYLHFRSKEEIALARVDRIVDQLNERLREIAASDASSAARIRRMLLERVMFRFDSVRHYTESLSDVLAAIRPALMIRHQGHFKQEAEIFAEVLREGRRDEELLFRDADATARALIVATNALLPYSLSPRELGHRKDVEAEITRIADLLINGLKSAATN